MFGGYSMAGYGSSEASAYNAHFPSHISFLAMFFFA